MKYYPDSKEGTALMNIKTAEIKYFGNKREEIKLKRMGRKLECEN